MEKEQLYNSLLKEGEKFYGGHLKTTLLDFKDAINTMEATKRLPECNWESIKHNHVTTYATMWQFTERLFNSNPERPIGLDKAPLSLLKWVYKGLSKAHKS